LFEALGIRHSDLEHASSKASSTDLEDRLRNLVLTMRNQLVAAAERSDKAANGSLRSSLYGLEAQAAGASMGAAATARDYIAHDQIAVSRQLDASNYD
jgi:hypothetical protein